jgi:anti-sigma regulatory factor (Ser/Thr protein kinase)
MTDTCNKIVAANVEKLPEITEFIEGCADQFGLDSKKKFGLLIAVEEAFVNVCNYSSPDRKGRIEVLCDRVDDALVVEILDSGSPFNVLSLPDPDTSLDIADREIGGLGGYFIRKFSDSVSYRRRNDQNVLRLVVNRSSSTGRL